MDSKQLLAAIADAIDATKVADGPGQLSSWERGKALYLLHRAAYEAGKGDWYECGHLLGRAGCDELAQVARDLEEADPPTEPTQPSRRRLLTPPGVPAVVRCGTCGASMPCGRTCVGCLLEVPR